MAPLRLPSCTPQALLGQAVIWLRPPAQQLFAAALLCPLLMVLCCVSPVEIVLLASSDFTTLILRVLQCISDSSTSAIGKITVEDTAKFPTDKDCPSPNEPRASLRKEHQTLTNLFIHKKPDDLSRRWAFDYKVKIMPDGEASYEMPPTTGISFFANYSHNSRLVIELVKSPHPRPGYKASPT